MADTDTTCSNRSTRVSHDPTLELTADLVAAYVSNNSLPAGELPGLIRSVRAAFADEAPADPPAEPAPAMPSLAEIRASITADALTSFIDGKGYKTLRRHLRTHGHSPESYRIRFGLPADYPMVAASYAAQRSALAKAFGLGRGASSAETESVGSGSAAARTRAAA